VLPVAARAPPAAPLDLLGGGDLLAGLTLGAGAAPQAYAPPAGPAPLDLLGFGGAPPPATFGCAPPPAAFGALPMPPTQQTPWSAFGSMTAVLPVAVGGGVPMRPTSAALGGGAPAAARPSAGTSDAFDFIGAEFGKK
jgi:hypothetical protein